MSKIGKFIHDMLISGSGVSSKRTMGCICIFFAMFISILELFIGEVGIIDDSVNVISLQFLGSGVALFGITSIEKFSRKNDCNKNDDTNSPESEN